MSVSGMPHPLLRVIKLDLLTMSVLLEPFGAFLMPHLTKNMVCCVVQIIKVFASILVSQILIFD